MTPLVSILIPSYNSGKYIVETIQSCMNQTYKNIEIIIVDDGSTDNSYQIAKLYESDKVKVYQQKNAGACRARNYAFELSTGDYIQYLDADDLLSPNKIEQQMCILDGKDPYMVASSKWDIFYDHPLDCFADRSIYKNYNDPNDILTDMWIKGEMMANSAWLASRQLIQNAGPWDEALKINQDGEFFFRILLHAKSVVFSPLGGVFYRKDNLQSVSRSNKSKAKAASLLESYIKYEDILKIIDKQEVRSSLAKNYADFIYQYAYIYPELTKIAFKKLNCLNVPVPLNIGGRLFRTLHTVLGFKKAIVVRHLIQK